MPASSVGALNSWGLYLIAAATLLLFLTPALSSTVRGSREGADWRDVDGVRAVLDSLRPGITAVISYGTSASADPLHLEGHEVTCDYGSGTISLGTRWSLPNVTLTPTVSYSAWLSAGEVEVAPAV